MSLPKCRGCDIEIRWARVDGRWCAFECEASRDGTHVLERDPINEREDNAIWVNPQTGKPRGSRYAKHNETCPAKEQFQRPRGAL